MILRRRQWLLDDSGAIINLAHVRFVCALQNRVVISWAHVPDLSENGNIGIRTCKDHETACAFRDKLARRLGAIR